MTIVNIKIVRNGIFDERINLLYEYQYTATARLKLAYTVGGVSADFLAA